MGKIIRLTESDIRNIVNEVISEYGAVWGKNNNGSVSLSVDADNEINNNTNKGIGIDNRIFAYKDSIEKNNSLYNQLNAMMEMGQSIIEYVNSGRKTQIKISQYLNGHTKSALQNHLENDTDEELITYANQLMARIQLKHDMLSNKVNDLQNTSNRQIGDKTMWYNVLTVPDTNVKCIALYTMSDFNFSDAIKHGKLRVNNKTSDVLATNSDSEGKLPINYDNTITPDIEANFSLSNVKNGHQTQQYSLNDKNYTSVAQFLDKSISYSASILNDLNYHPDFILCAPSSSKFNDYFCTRLSNKISVPFINGFFKRNVVNIKLGKNDYADEMRKHGFGDDDIMKFGDYVKNIAFNEINYIITKPVNDLVNNNVEIFNAIPIEKSSRTKFSINQIKSLLANEAYRIALQQTGNDAYVSNIAKVMNIWLEKQNKYKSLNTQAAIEHIMKFSKINTNRKLKYEWTNVIQLFIENINLYANKLSTGFKPTYKSKQFKVVSIEKRFRPFLKDVYIIADKYTNFGQLNKRFANAKFLIYDEDINSGATLKMLIDTLEENVGKNNNILCLANAYSDSGR